MNKTPHASADNQRRAETNPAPKHGTNAHGCAVAQPRAVGVVRPPCNQTRPAPPAAPPVYRPQHAPKILQRKPAAVQPPRPAQPLGRHEAPPVYRPQAAPACVQPKVAHAPTQTTPAPTHARPSHVPNAPQVPQGPRRQAFVAPSRPQAQPRPTPPLTTQARACPPQQKPAAPRATGPVFALSRTVVQRMEAPISGGEPPERPPNPSSSQKPGVSNRYERKKQKQKQKKQEKKQRDALFKAQQQELKPAVGNQKEEEEEEEVSTPTPRNNTPINNNNSPKGRNSVEDKDGKRKFVKSEPLVKKTPETKSNEERPEKKRKKRPPRYNVVDGFYKPIASHNMCGQKHILGGETKTKAAKFEGAKTQVNKSEAQNALAVINRGEARFAGLYPNEENPASVIVIVSGRRWGAHITDAERKIYPMD